jgi:predicted nucleic acid-binding protein
VRAALDTNILSGLWSRGPLGPQIWSRLRSLQLQGGLVICGPVYVELYANPNITPTFVDDFLTATGIATDFALDDEVWRSAAKAFAAYADRRRRSRGATSKRLPIDFLVASHASLRADALMTLDADLYRMDFPNLALLGL